MFPEYVRELGLARRAAEAGSSPNLRKTVDRVISELIDVAQAI